MKKVTVITILVDTKGINQSNKNEKIYMLDSHGGSERPGDPQDYVAIVNKNGEVIWVAYANPFEKNPGTVTLEKIEKKHNVPGNANILKKDSYTPDKSGRIIGETKDKDIPGAESYNIHLYINNDHYIIDPKLEMHG